jgi:hypothetical protein
MKIDQIFFDICDFLHTENVRELTVLRNGELIKISEEQVGNTDLWIVLSHGVHTLLKEDHHDAYVWFFGALLTALHMHNASMPIRGICMGDVHHALEHSTTQPLVDAIASGTYLPSQKTNYEASTQQPGHWCQRRY